MVTRYIPDRGDIVWIDFDPQKGREIQKRRPALILTSKKYNKRSLLCVLVPITSKLKNYPFEVPMMIKEGKGKQIPSAILSDQIKSMDYGMRRVKFIQKAPTEVLEEVVRRFTLLISDGKISLP